MRLQIRNNEAWILRKKGSTSYTIFDCLEAVQKELYKMKDVKEIELMKLTLTHNGGRLEQNDKFWMKICLILKRTKEKKGDKNV